MLVLPNLQCTNAMTQLIIQNNSRAKRGLLFASDVPVLPSREVYTWDTVRIRHLHAKPQCCAGWNKTNIKSHIPQTLKSNHHHHVHNDNCIRLLHRIVC